MFLIVIVANVVGGRWLPFWQLLFWGNVGKANLPGIAKSLPLGQYCPMAKSIRDTLDTYGVRRVAEASGIPFWTLRKWRDRDRVPGEGVAQEMRVRAIKAGIAKLEVEDETIGNGPKSNGRRKAAK